ncbi:hypothetical protein DACRYDRAFT_22016 [Dacryopinax primogenitus]|uniref:Tetraspannin-domain-containing protein n=1 Tax=Dacryopinax primogenitus (strain DJM 731) TaxID=1858805 RepID=M5G8Z4_DACPD|nr:uncharacterized protein DACRYDRAFT_22016 [Dacryopinax primogenitus]EJU02342.1 hypothetical protein DACRYDRAFT_22016 [Dacryopinax primogenitus]
METFCCCIPVRLGVFILSLLTIALGALVSAASWVQLSKLGSDADTQQKVIIIIAGVVYGLLAFFSLLGFIGSVIANRALVKTYSVMLWINWFLSLISGGLAIWQLFRADAVPNVVQSCQASDTTATEADCTNAFKVIRVVYIIIFVILELIVLYACVIVSRYVDQLKQEEMFHHVENLEHQFASRPAPVVMQYGAPAYAPLPAGNPSTQYVNKAY